LLSGQGFGYHLLTHEALEIELMKHLVAFVMIAFLLSTVAVLLPATVSTVAVAKDNPCKQDKKKFCKDAKSKGVKVRACLKQHKDELSAECKAHLDKKEEETPTPSEEPVPGTSDGASE
jgi:hypothetical protein